MIEDHKLGIFVVFRLVDFLEHDEMVSDDVDRCASGDSFKRFGV